MIPEEHRSFKHLILIFTCLVWTTSIRVQPVPDHSYQNWIWLNGHHHCVQHVETSRDMVSDHQTEVDSLRNNTSPEYGGGGGGGLRRVFPRRTWVLPPLNWPFWVHWCGQFHTIRPVTVPIGTGNVGKIRRLKSHISGHEILKLVEGFSYPWSHECFDTKLTMI